MFTQLINKMIALNRFVLIDSFPLFRLIQNMKFTNTNSYKIQIYPDYESAYQRLISNPNDRSSGSNAVINIISISYNEFIYSISLNTLQEIKAKIENERSGFQISISSLIWL